MVLQARLRLATFNRIQWQEARIVGTGLSDNQPPKRRGTGNYTVPGKASSFHYLMLLLLHG